MIKGFITNLGKYNEGFLLGEWIEFPIDEEELEKVYSRIGINEEYEEVFFADWETDINGLSEYLGEYPSIDEVNEIAETIENFSSYEMEVFQAACEIWNFKEVMANDIDDYGLIDAYNDYDLGYYWIEESDCYNLSNMGNLANYIDFEAFGRDYRLETDGDYSSLGWIERR